MFYLDSSALVKRYVTERGSMWLRAQLPNGFIVATLACAIHADQQIRQAGQGPITFLVADNNLLLAGVVEGLLVDNPENYPP